MSTPAVERREQHHQPASAPAGPGTWSAGGDAPASIGRYRITAELGRGGMGVVYLGWDPQLRRRVAIKVIIETSWVVEQEDIDRFLREAQVGARLAHPAIVRTIDVGSAGGKPYIVMEYVEGRSLELVLRGELSPRRLAELVGETAAALDHAHREGVVHRDVKPHNIIVDDSGRPHLTDFGLARDTATIKQLTLSGDSLGTPAYMAPEQARGDSASVGPPADVWALGVILYRGLTGKLPFEGQTAFATMQMVMQSDPALPRAIDPTLHRDVETIALRCLEKEPERRYPTAAAVARELARFLVGDPIEARPVGRVEAVWRWIRRSPARATAAVLALLLVLSIPVGLALLVATRAGAREAERDALVAEAKADFDAAWIALEDARAVTPPDHGRRFASAHAALREAGRYHGLAGGLATAAIADVTIALAEIALDAEQWSVAESALRDAGRFAANPARLRALQARLDAARAARVEAVAAILADARSGELARRTSGFDDAVFELVRLEDAETVGLVCDALERVTERRHRELREGILGFDPSRGLRSDEADDWLRRGGEPFPPEGRDATVVTVILRKAQATPTLAEATRAGFARKSDALRALAQLVPGRAGDVATARLCLVVLGRVAPNERVRAALRGYLAVEVDEERAVPGGIAACRAGDAEAFAIVVAAFSRFGPVGPFSQTVGREVVLRGLRLPEAAPEDRVGAGDIAAFNARLTELTVVARSDPVGILPRFDALLAQFPEHEALILVNRGLARFQAAQRDRTGRQRHIDAGRADLDRAILLEPSEANAWLNRSLIRLIDGDDRGALADAIRATEVDPSSSKSWSQRARVALMLGEPAEAGRLADGAIARDPRNRDLRLVRGEIRFRLGDYAGAIADFDVILQAEPGDAAALGQRALAKAVSGDPHGAIADADQAQGIAPELYDAWHARGIARRALRQLDRAIVDLGRAIELEPSEPGAWSQRGICHALAGDLDAADADFTRTIALAPGHPDSWLSRARVRYTKRDGPGALADCNEALRRAPDYAPALLLRGRTRAATGDRERAAADLRRALELFPPGSEDAATARELLRGLGG